MSLLTNYCPQQQPKNAKSSLLGAKNIFSFLQFSYLLFMLYQAPRKKVTNTAEPWSSENVSPFVVLQTQINTRLRESLKLEKPVVVIVSHRTCFEFVRTTDAVVRLLQKRNQFGLPAVFRLFVVSC